MIYETNIIVQCKSKVKSPVLDKTPTSQGSF